MTPSPGQPAPAPLVESDPPAVATHVDALRATFRSGRTRALAWRREALAGLGRFLDQEAEAIVAALAQDLGRPAAEAWTAEIGTVRSEIAHALAHLSRWTRPRRVRLPLLAQPGKAWVQAEPLGVVLILGPWNYPIQLVLAPLVGALAAGNTALLKPSELAPASAALLAERLGRHLDPDAVRVVQGGPEVARALLAQPFDHIFFTGGAAIGREVMRAAAARLCPVTLELGGKSPVVVDASADIAVAARRIAWGRYMNAGQTCVAPDYALVERTVAPAFLAALQDAVHAMYGGDPKASADYGRIVNARHLGRLRGLLRDQEITFGGGWDEAQRYLEPTAVWDPDPDSTLMQEEIFGPILPVLPWDDLGEALALVAARSAPLAVYAFSTCEETLETLRQGTRSGAFVVNDVVVQLLAPDLPFGGVGASGMGRTHGRAGFEAFSNPRTHLRRSTLLDPSLRYPPYSARGQAWMKHLL